MVLLIGKNMTTPLPCNMHWPMSAAHKRKKEEESVAKEERRREKRIERERERERGGMEETKPDYNVISQRQIVACLDAAGPPPGTPTT